MQALRCGPCSAAIQPSALPAAPFRYVGCYKEAAARGLPALLAGSSDWPGATIEACYKLAKAAGYRIFGVQNYFQCWGGNDLTAATMYGVGTCTNPCRGDPAQICGDGWVNSVYEILGEARPLKAARLPFECSCRCFGQCPPPLSRLPSYPCMLKSSCRGKHQAP